MPPRSACRDLSVRGPARGWRARLHLKRPFRMWNVLRKDIEGIGIGAFIQPQGMVAEGRQLLSAELLDIGQHQFLAGLAIQYSDADETHPRGIVLELVGLERI